MVQHRGRFHKDEFPEQVPCSSEDLISVPCPVPLFMSTAINFPALSTPWDVFKGLPTLLRCPRKLISEPISDPLLESFRELCTLWDYQSFPTFHEVPYFGQYNTLTPLLTHENSYPSSFRPCLQEKVLLSVLLTWSTTWKDSSHKVLQFLCWPYHDLNILLTKHPVDVLTTRTNVLGADGVAKVVLAPKKINV